ncbi:transposase [archaeon SCG-AAA382B04]|nr:transposase [archaeon SCG-AAA382B04]
MNLSYKYRLYPSEKDKKVLEKNLDLCRQVYNHFLEKLNKKDETPSRYELQKQLPKLKKKWTELKQVHSKVLQMVLKQLYDNLKSLSEQKRNGYKVGKLRCKGEEWFKTIEYNQSGFKLKRTENRLDKLRLSKIGKIPIQLHRELEEEAKGVIIKRNNTGEWYAIFQTEQETEKQNSVNSDDVEAVGIDLGIQNFIVDSDSNRVEHPKNVEKAEEQLKKAQRNLSRKEKGSNNHKKQRKRVAKLHEQVKNRRMDFLHKLSNAYVNKYDRIVLEDLNISSMVQGKMNSKNTLDSGWRKFIQLLLYKAESAGIEVVLVDPKDTSKKCSQCGVKTNKPLWQREHSCPSCGYKTDRDYNAAQNILEKSLGEGRAKVTPVETEASTDTNFRDVSASFVIETGSPFLTSEVS